uniref:Calcium-transporting ATPase n=1 Tax=Helianthus annuus TaxID=4232 RepID=A0A251TH09_HELAN
MVSEIQPLHDIGNMLYNISTTTLTLTNAKKRWRRAYFSVYFSNAMASIAKDVFSKALPVSHPTYSVINIKESVTDHFYGIDQTQLVDIIQNKDMEALHRFAGVKGLAKTLHTHLDDGIDGQDLNERRTVFGSNTYHKPPPKGLFYFVVEAFKDVTILILMGCAVLSLGFGIKEDGINEGWYEGGSILLAVFLVIVVSAVSNFRQEKQFDSLSKISNNIKTDVVREGRRQKISIFDIVVGDIVIPADGLFIDGHSLLVDESSMTGESDQIDVNAISNPFLISGAKVADGHCRMLVLSVGMNTTWGKMMSSITGDNNEQTPLQSRLNKLTSSIGKDLDMDMEKMKQGSTVLHVETFNSKKKRSGVSIRRKDNTIHVHWKGAAEMVLGMCSKYYNSNGSKMVINGDSRKQLENIIEGMAASSLRCIAFAHKKVLEGTDYQTLTEEGLTLLGIVGLKDPCRPGSKKAIETCRSAGVEIKMITGDNVFTAKAIATECGILESGQEVCEDEVVEGVQFRNFTDEERMQKVDKIRVMARSSPFDKLLMVKCLKQKGHVVAVTGDGTNDAPALKEADIGLSMGIQGTEVAKQSSDIVILDDDIASVSTVLMWGRCVYTNIQKFIQFQLTVNVAALVINFIAAVTSGAVPLTAVQLLWVNLIMDTLGALALATEGPTKELLNKPPVGRVEPLITNIMWRNLLAQAIFQITVLLTFQFKGKAIFNVDERVKDTIIFNTFVLCQVFNEFNSRKLEKRNIFKGIHKNRLFVGIIGITLILQVVMVEFLKKFADTERLNGVQWGICIGIAALSWPIGWVVKLIPVPNKPFLSYIRC